MMFFLIAMIVLSVALVAIVWALVYVALVDHYETIDRKSTRGKYAYRMPTLSTLVFERPEANTRNIRKV